MRRFLGDWGGRRAMSHSRRGGLGAARQAELRVKRRCPFWLTFQTVGPLSSMVFPSGS
jgi:hypothetical protein